MKVLLSYIIDNPSKVFDNLR